MQNTGEEKRNVSLSFKKIKVNLPKDYAYYMFNMKSGHTQNVQRE